MNTKASPKQKKIYIASFFSDSKVVDYLVIHNNFVSRCIQKSCKREQLSFAVLVLFFMSLQILHILALSQKQYIISILYRICTVLVPHKKLLNDIYLLYIVGCQGVQSSHLIIFEVGILKIRVRPRRLQNFDEIICISSFVVFKLNQRLI